MEQLLGKIVLLAGNLRRNKSWLLLMVCLAMFVLAAGAPNATIGIGK